MFVGAMFVFRNFRLKDTLKEFGLKRKHNNKKQQYIGST